MYQTNSAWQPARAANGRVVGAVEGDTLRKDVRGSVHILRTPRGLASDISTLQEAQEAGARYIEITDVESGNVYRAAISTMLERGIEFDRGYGRQVVLSLDQWQRPDLADQLELIPPISESPFLQEPPRPWWDFD